jgi:hypothetical protein
MTSTGPWQEAPVGNTKPVRLALSSKSSPRPLGSLLQVNPLASGPQMVVQLLPGEPQVMRRS